MRLSEEQIKQGILHPDMDVRQACLRYFADGFSRNTTVMPLVIQALEQYGRADAFRYIFLIASLPQTQETIRWVLGELTSQPRRTEQEQNYLKYLSRLLCQADPELVLPHENVILTSPGFNQNLASPLRRRLSFLSWEAQALWQELEAICEEAKDKSYVKETRFHEGREITETLAGRGNLDLERMMSLLGMKVDNFENNPMKWMEPLMVHLAGELRHAPAIPLIVAKLHEEGEVVTNECHQALVKMGTDEVVRLIRDAYLTADGHFRLFASGVLGEIHTELAVQTCIELLEKEEDLDLQNWMAQSLVNHFSFEGNEVARKVLLADPDLFDLQCGLVPACILTGQAFPELAEWHKEIEEKLRPKPRFPQPRPAPLPGKAPLSTAPPPPEKPPGRPRTPPVTVERKVGRNDPCPCGSGKKFKNCCRNKQGKF